MNAQDPVTPFERPIGSRSCRPGYGRVVLRSVLLVFVFFYLAPAFGQISNPAFFEFDPDPPIEARSFTLSLFIVPCLSGEPRLNDPMDRVMEVSPGRIEVTVWHASTPCLPNLLNYYLPILIDPVPAGTYELLVQGRSVGQPHVVTPLFATQVTVVASNLSIIRPAVVPALSLPWLILLGCSAVLIALLRFPRGG